MKKLFVPLAFLLTIYFGYGQVGINTTTPAAQLEIKSTNQATPANNDGILIPKIDAFPATNPTAAQNSMMVYLTTTSAGKSPGFYYWDNATTSWKGFGSDFGWSLTGNTGTTPGTNFVGTTDDKNLVFKRNNLQSGLLTNANSSFGVRALNPASTGVYNTAIGVSSLQNNTLGHSNTTVGSYAMYTNTDGVQNTAVGTNAMYYNSNGQKNSALGNNAQNANTTGSNNVAIGSDALSVNQTGSSNTAVGFESGKQITGNGNLTLGSGATVPNLSGDNQLSIGNIVYGTGMNSGLTAKIGINEPAPSAKLQINPSNASTPAVDDGIIIPRVNTFPFLNPGAAQNGMMVFLATANPGYPVGFYYWDNPSTSWKGFDAGKPKFYTVVGTTDIAATTSSLPMAEMTQTFTPNSSAVFVQFGAGGYNLGGSCGQYPVYFNILLNGVLVKTVQTSMENISSFDRPIWDINAIYPITVSPGVTCTVSINWFTTCPWSNSTLNNANTPAPSGNYQAYRTLTIIDPNGGGGVVGSPPVTTNSWALNGNAGTNPTSNFIGTIDDKDIVFKRNNQISGSLGLRNVSFGGLSLLNNTAGIYNSAFGHSSLYSNAAGHFNTALGHSAMYYNNAGSNGTAIGCDAMYNSNNSTTPFDNKNVAVGYRALYGSSTAANNIGNSNTALGYQTLLDNSSGSNNLALGVEALKQNTTGSSNIAIGNTTLSGNIAGSNNIAIGNNANVNTIDGSNQLSINNVIYGMNMNDLATAPANISIGTIPSVKYRFYNYTNQVTTNGDGQYGLFTYRTRDSQNDGTSYAAGNTNAANAGYNYWGDLYTFGTIGYSYNDFTRTGGVLGAVSDGSYWSSLGYRSSAFTNYGIYASAAGYAQGTGRMAQAATEFSIGGGFYGGLIGSWSRGNLIGQICSGTLFASYNRGDEYTSGKQIELVDTGTSKTPAYTVTSTESVIYKKGKINLNNGVARVEFDENYKNLLGDIPVVTTTPMGPCNGIYIESVDKNGFTIRELNSGTSNVAISWIAVGDRIDANRMSIPNSVLATDFDSNLNDAMFNENNLNDSGKAIWSDGRTINFGKLPENLIDKPVKKEEKRN